MSRLKNARLWDNKKPSQNGPFSRRLFEILMSNSVHADKKLKLEEYIRLIESFVADRIAASEFETQYLEVFKNDETLWQEREYETLNGLFTDIDAFCADASLRDNDDLDEPELRAQASVALRTLKSLVTV